jgi:hypothetical protein
MEMVVMTETMFAKMMIKRPSNRPACPITQVTLRNSVPPQMLRMHFIYRKEQSFSAMARLTQNNFIFTRTPFIHPNLTVLPSFVANSSLPPLSEFS